MKPKTNWKTSSSARTQPSRTSFVGSTRSVPAEVVVEGRVVGQPAARPAPAREARVARAAVCPLCGVGKQEIDVRAFGLVGLRICEGCAKAGNQIGRILQQVFGS